MGSVSLSLVKFGLIYAMLVEEHILISPTGLGFEKTPQFKPCFEGRVPGKS